MASKPDGFALPAWLAATALSAIFWWFGSGVDPIWWATWLAPLPVLWLAPRVRAHWAALAAFMAYTAGGFNALDYLHTYIGMPLPVIVYGICFSSVMLTLCVLLFRRLLMRDQVLAAALAVPSAWVAIEYINSVLSPYATFFNISYTQMDALAIVQLAAVTGIWGIGFLLLLVPTAIALQAAPQTQRRDRVVTMAIAALLVIAATVYGGWRLQAPATETIRAGLVMLEKPNIAALNTPEGEALTARYLDAFDRLAKAGARILLIPETSFSAAEATIPAFAEFATQRNLVVGTGVAFKGDPNARRNALMVFQPGATSPSTYYKHHLLVGLEQYTPGDSYTTLGGTPRIGLAICKDMDYHDIGNAYAALRTQLMLVPASDFVVDGWLHSRMAIMRGVESGFAIARSARAGRLTLSDDRGRVVAEASSERSDAELVGDLPLRETHTLYASWGDWFAWLDLATLAVCLVLAFRPRG
jgi:apolipoprotein N-acyltransferase